MRKRYSPKPGTRQFTTWNIERAGKVFDRFSNCCKRGWADNRQFPHKPVHVWLLLSHIGPKPWRWSKEGESWLGSASGRNCAPRESQWIIRRLNHKLKEQKRGRDSNAVYIQILPLWNNFEEITGLDDRPVGRVHKMMPCSGGDGIFIPACHSLAKVASACNICSYCRFSRNLFDFVESFTGISSCNQPGSWKWNIRLRGTQRNLFNGRIGGCSSR